MAQTILLLFLFFGVFGSALGEGNYGGLRLGMASSGIDSSTLDDGSVISNVNLEETANAYSAYLGFRTGRLFAVELAYTNLGAPAISGSSDGSGFFWFAGQVEAAYKTNALHLDLVARPRLSERFSVMGKLGYYRASTTLALTDSCCTVEVEENNTGLVLGGGLTFQILENMSLQADWTRFMGVGNDSSIGSSDIDIMGFSLLYYFREERELW